MRYCTECELKGTDECHIKVLSDRIGVEIIAEGCVEWALKEEGAKKDE